LTGDAITRTYSALARRIVIAACVVAHGGAHGACQRDAAVGAATASSDAVICHDAAKTRTGNLKKPKTLTKAAHSARRVHKKSKPARRQNVFYQWSAEQLMLGGVNPSRIGSEVNGGIGNGNGKRSGDSAASKR
jgi:hypothetical protein